MSMRVLPYRYQCRHQRSRARQRGFIINPFAFGNAAPGPIVVDAADFDGTNDYMQKLSGFTGNGTNSANGILSFWYSYDAVVNGRVFWGQDSVTPLTRFELAFVTVSSNYAIRIVRDGSASTSQNTTASVQGPGANVWHHFIADFASGKWYLDDADISPSTNNVGTVAYANINQWYVGANNLGTQKYDGGLAEFYFAPTQSIDLTQASNRQKWRSALGKPMDLGTTGNIPTGTAPACYLHLNDGEAASNFATNRSGNGNFTINGALTTYATSPSD